jgi:ATP synthase protein I
MAADEFDREAQSQQDSRLTSLDQRLDRIKQEDALRSAGKVSAESQRLIRSVGMRILSVLIGYPVGGGLIGWTLDQWFGTLPWCTLGLMFLGFGLAVREVLRTANQGPRAGLGD